MRTIMLVAAIIAALGMASQPTDARDRGFSSGHAGPKLHLRHHGLKFHHGSVFGKHRPFKSRHFGHFAHRAFPFKFKHVPQFRPRHFGHFAHHGFPSKFGHVPQFKPRHLGHFGQRALVFKFSDGDVVLRFGHVPFRHRQFSRRHHHHGLFFGFDQPRRFRPWRDRGFAFEDRREVPVRRQSMPGSHGGGGGGLHGGAPPEALLKQLEEMGFRDVPELLRSGHR